MNFLLWIILSPLALVVGLVVCFCFGVGFVVMMNIYKSGRHPGIDYSNYIGRLLGFIQLSRHIPRLMRAVFIFRPYVNVVDRLELLELPPGVYTLIGESGPIDVHLTRPLLRMNRQDLMEQVGFRPDDGRVDGKFI